MNKNTGIMTYNPMYKLKDENVFEVSGLDLDKWKFFYPEFHKIMPLRIIEDLGKFVFIKTCVDANH